MWGFTPDYFEYSEAYFKEFLSDPKNMENLKAEFFIPLMVNKLITEGTATCEVLDTTSKWFGVTYAADRQDTVDRIKRLVDEGRLSLKEIASKLRFSSQSYFTRAYTVFYGRPPSSDRHPAGK